MDATEVNQAINTMFRAADLMLNVPKSMTDVLKAVVDDKVTPNAVVKAMNTTLNKEIEKGNANILYMDPDPEKLKEVEKMLMYNDVYCQTGIYKGRGVVITLEAQRETAQMVFNKYFAKDEFKFVSPTELNSVSNGAVHSFTVDSEEQAIMIQKRCEQNNIQTNIVHSSKLSRVENPRAAEDVMSIMREEGEENYVTRHTECFQIRYCEKDKEIMEQIKQDVAIDFAGKGGSIITKQLQWENQHTCDVLNSVLNVEYQRGTYVADKNGNSICINKYDVDIMRSDGTSEKIKYRDAEYTEKLTYEICRMNHPVHLTEERMNELKNLSDKQRDEYILDVEREQGRPAITKEEYFILAAKEKERALLNEKLNQEHPDSVRRDLNDYNSEQPLICFKEVEKENYEASHDISESEFVDATILNDASAINEGMIDSNDGFTLRSEIELEETLERTINGLDESLDEMTHSVDTIDVETELD